MRPLPPSPACRRAGLALPVTVGVNDEPLAHPAACGWRPSIRVPHSPCQLVADKDRQQKTPAERAGGTPWQRTVGRGYEMRGSGAHLCWLGRKVIPNSPADPGDI
uniref:Uncharacterized protein n=1 Tax=Sphaerodactylus townsendi TaxID=933632 RepID=A0ACB8G4S7_9SAUR